MYGVPGPGNLWTGQTHEARTDVEESRPSSSISRNNPTRAPRRVVDPLLFLLFIIITISPATCQRCRSADATMTLEDDLTTASAKGNTGDVECLLRAGADVNGVNCYGRSALQVMMMGSTPVAQVLLTHGADPNVADRSTGTTPLHDAARTGFLDTVRLLVLFQADPQARDHTQSLPIDLAKDNGHMDVVAFLKSL